MIFIENCKERKVGAKHGGFDIENPEQVELSALK